MSTTLLALVAYLAIQLAVGVWVSRRIRTEADYLIAGRRLGPVLASFSIYATWFGAETVIGSGGRAYDSGVSPASSEPFAYGLCLILMGAVFAVPLWKRQLTTLADLYRQRYSPTVERVAAIVLIPSSILWAAAQIRAFGSVLATTSPSLNLELAIAVAAGFTLLYTMVGGLLADAMNDLIQGIVLAIGLGLLLFATVDHFGGVAATAAAATAGGRVSLVPADMSGWALLEEWAIPVCGSVLATELVSRVIAARSPGVARRSSFVGAGMYLAVGSIPLVVGLTGAAIVGAPSNPEGIVPAVALQLLSPFLFAIFAGGLVAAILSTVDSTLLVASGLLSHNLLVPAFGISADTTKLRLARAGVAAFGVVAYVLALRAEGVFALVEQASAFGGAPALVTICFALFSTIGGPRAALASLIGGVASYLAASYGGFAYPFLLSLAVSLAAYLIGAATERRTLAPHAR